MFNRDNAFSMVISDPDGVDDSKIFTLKNLNDKKLLAFKEKSTYQLITASTIDPDHSHPDTAHTYEKISNYGSSSSYFARIFLQTAGILESFNFSEQSQFIESVWELNLLLVKCAKSRDEIFSQVEATVPLCDSLIQEHKHKGSIPPLPQVQQLDLHTKAFLTTGKLFLIDCFKLLQLFSRLEIRDRQEASFKVHIDWLANKCEILSDLGKVLQQDFPWIDRLAKFRNAIEHPSKGLSLTIQNFQLLPGNKFMLPTWSYDIGQIQAKGISCITDDMNIFLHNMLHMLEFIILSCIETKLASNPMMALYHRNELNPQCPIMYYASLNKELLSKIKDI